MQARVHLVFSQAGHEILVWTDLGVRSPRTAINLKLNVTDNTLTFLLSDVVINNPYQLLIYWNFALDLFCAIFAIFLKFCATISRAYPLRVIRRFNIILIIWWLSVKRKKWCEQWFFQHLSHEQAFLGTAGRPWTVHHFQIRAENWSKWRFQDGLEPE